MHSSQEKVSKFQTKSEGVLYRHIDIAKETEMEMQDVFLFFNRSKEATPSYSNYVDIIKILSFMKKNLNQNGYIVFGNCFTSDGEIRVLEELLDAFGLKI